MKKKFSREQLRYRIDCIMSKGPIAMSILLFAVMILIVGLIGVVAFFVADEGNIFYQLWSSLMHTLDAGTLANNPTDNIPYLVLMTLSTLCGLFVTSVLIGIVANGVESKFNDLRKGASVVQEQNHTVIIGFDNNIFTLLNELIESNANKKNCCIVVLGDCPKDEMEDVISARIPDTKTTRIICRSGKTHEVVSLKRCSIENSRSVIVNIHDDAETVKALLALSTCVRDKQLLCPDLTFVLSLQDSQYIEAAYIAGEGRAKIIYAKDAIARIITNTCRQHGLSRVLTELFNFSGDEIYFESVPSFEGKTFKEAMLSFSNATLIGLSSDGEARLNPPMDTIISKNDKLVLIENDDGDYKIHAVKTVDESQICGCEQISAKSFSGLIIIGTNDKLPIILTEYNLYMQKGTEVIIVDEDMNDYDFSLYDNLNIKVCQSPVTRSLLVELLDEKTNNVLLMNDDSTDPESSDSQTLLRLILLRDIADKTNRHLAITTEMRSAENQQLASKARVDDFVIGSNFTCLLMAQISENPSIFPFITELLDESGSELYMKSISDYVSIGEPVDSYTLTESAARKGEVYVGYRLSNGTASTVVVNPLKDETMVFGENDQIVVIAEE